MAMALIEAVEAKDPYTLVIAACSPFVDGNRQGIGSAARRAG